MNVRMGFALVVTAFIAVLLLDLPPAAFAAADQLDLPVVEQEHSEWCWDADASAVLAFRGVPATQCAIGNWVGSIDYACGNYPFYWDDPANSPNYLAGTTGIAGILWYWGRRDSRYYTEPLAYPAVRSAIMHGHPIVVLWNWYGGGGHFIVIDGYDDDGSMVYFMNPWPGEGAGIGDYEWTRDGSGEMGTHWWSESLIIY
ncbi:papain like cysteine protease AvrRpt2 [Trinickia symbiotica]|uniref:Peptidase C39-like domain-containing protein n=1 Tax=Trinickia symbiotica TaxID=863227 RepID=A0A2N7X650_9BURK|nr:papain-like cysteine protease family protein [Trinickia symbiotica]PMS37080.1 hypothetical protein C0Z20_10230 [Trinickia symbiotica]PPK42980.1 papain like cysteine protease AvrRpt2 [Trinickia symbiotica]